MSEEIKKDRSIGLVGADVKSVLNWKMQHYQNENLPVGLIADYIHKGIEEVDLKIANLKKYKKLIDEEIKELETHKDLIKIETASWFNENGFDKLQGVEVSSITLTKEVEAKEEKVIEKTFKCDMTKQEINDFLVTQDLASYEKKEIIKVTPKKLSTIKINKKRK